MDGRKFPREEIPKRIWKYKEWGSIFTISEMSEMQYYPMASNQTINNK